MSATDLILRDPLGERPLAAHDFPISVGGPGHTIVLPGAPAGTLAWLALHEGQLFLQPVEGQPALLCNGAAIFQPTWLREGDVVDVARGRLRVGLRDGIRVLDVEDGSGGNLTVPPEAPPVPVVAGAEGDEDERIEAVRFRAAARAAGPRRRWLVAVPVAIVLALVTYAAWFLATGYAFTITTAPAAARVDLRGGPSLHFGANRFARPGRYSVTVQHAGYVTLRAPLEVAAASGREHHYRLEKLPGRVRIETPLRARVTADGRELGEAPGEFRLPAGRRELAVLAPRHQPWTTTLEVEGLDRVQTVTPALVPAWAPLTVVSEPAGAEVYVDGERSGVTPARVELDAGSHRVELRHPGFKAWATDVQVAANEPQTLGPVRLGLPDGRLTVRTEPAGAAVSVGGAFRGRAPLTLDVRPDTRLALVATRDGHEPATAAMVVGPGERRTVELKLAPILGEVTVRAEPAGAEVYADGRLLGPAGRTYRLPSARHELEVRLAGYRSHRTTLTPRPALPQVVEVRLEPGGPPSSSAATTAAVEAAQTKATPAAGGAGPLAATLRAPSGSELRLLGPASYTMGSPRRESGRRANESQRPVVLRRRYYLATDEVTNAQYKQFRPRHRSGFVGQHTLELERQPVVNVTWQDAAEYCNWLSQQAGLPAAYESQGGKLVPVSPMTTGYRLPTEAEWEWAARANRDGSLRKYPWGDALPVPAASGNYGDRKAQPLLQTFLEDLDDGYAATANVGSFGANALGFHDLGGNVAEWTTDLYVVQPPSTAVAVDPLGAGAGNVRVIRGSSWRHATVTELRAAHRDYGDGRRDDLGFRIARYAE